jgi:hypothetical protein
MTGPINVCLLGPRGMARQTSWGSAGAKAYECPATVHYVEHSRV